MTTRARWITLVLLLVVLGLVALYVFNSNLTMSSEEQESEVPVVHGWVIQPGQTRTWLAEHVGPLDQYRCPGKGGVNGTPDPGTSVSNSAGLTIETAEDGTVTATCEPGPPGNA